MSRELQQRKDGYFARTYQQNKEQCGQFLGSMGMQNNGACVILYRGNPIMIGPLDPIVMVGVTSIGCNSTV